MGGGYMKRGLILFSLLSICVLTANSALAKTLTEELTELYIKRSKGIITQSELEKQREELKTNSSQPNGRITTPQDKEKRQPVVEARKTEANFDHSSFKSSEEQRKFNELIETGNFEKAIQVPARDSQAYRMALGFLNLKSNYTPSKVSSELPNDLSNVSIVVFATKYWKAADMIRLSDEMKVSVNGSSFFGETVDQDKTNGSFITKRFNFQLQKGKHEFTLTYPAERRRAYGYQNDRFGKWCLKNCEFKFSLNVNGPMQEIRVIDFFKKAGTMGNFVVGEKFQTQTEYDSLLAKRKDQENDENNTQAFLAALAIGLSQDKSSTSYLPAKNYPTNNLGSNQIGLNPPTFQRIGRQADSELNDENMGKIAKFNNQGYTQPSIQPQAFNANSIGNSNSPRLFSQNGQYLGNLNKNKYDPNSVSNPYGQYGSPYSSTSINNPYSQYGSPFSQDSISNPYTTEGPKIIANDGQYLGNLNSNKYDPNSVSNPYGQYGSPYSPTSVNNPYSQYGSPYSPTSAKNPYSH